MYTQEITVNQLLQIIETQFWMDELTHKHIDQQGDA